jgi:putative ABC transport system substrate-binding protein
MAARYARAGCAAYLSLWYVIPLSTRFAFDVAFFDELRARGFIEGKNLIVDYRDFAQRGDLVSEYAEELVEAQPNVLYVGGGAAIRAAQKAAKTIPILGVADDMVGEGLVDTLTRPNGNTTGVSILANELDGNDRIS